MVKQRKQTRKWKLFPSGFSETEEGARTLTKKLDINDTYGSSIYTYLFTCIYIYKPICIHEHEFIKNRLAQFP